MIGLGEHAQRRVAVLLADVLGEPLEVTLPVAEYLDGYVRRAPFQAALGLRAVLWALTWLPLLFVGVPLPVDRLPAALRLRYARRWASSRVYFIREGFYLLKAIALMGWAAQPLVRERLGVGSMEANVRDA